MTLPDGQDWSETVKRSEIEKAEKLRELDQNSGEIKISFPAIYRFIKRFFSRKRPV